MLCKYRVLNFVIFSLFILAETVICSIFGCKVKFTCSFSDIDECKESRNTEISECHQNASCINTQGSYNCSCNPTYIGNGFECEGTFVLSKYFQLVKAVLDEI